MNFIPDWGILQKVHRFFDTESKDEAPAGMSRRDFLRYTGAAAVVAAAPALFIPPQRIFAPEMKVVCAPFFNKLEVVGVDWGLPLDQVSFLAIERNIMREICEEHDRAFLEALRA